MTYPIPQGARRPLLKVLAALCLPFLFLTGGGLNSRRTPGGIVDLELAGTESRARAVLDAWDAGAQRHAVLAVRLDFLFLLVYSTAISVACMLAAGRLAHRPYLARVGRPLAWLQWGAAKLDAIENVALLQMLGGRVQQPWPRIARTCALPKFTIIALGLVYALIGWVAGKPVAAQK